jgi:acyl-coenzyme A thioesterase 9
MFNSRVLYTSSNTDASGKLSSSKTKGPPLIHLEVEAWVTVPEKADAKLSNQFYFTFAVEESNQETHQPLRKILPANIDEATRMATRMEADKAQAVDDIE